MSVGFILSKKTLDKDFFFNYITHKIFFII